MNKQPDGTIAMNLSMTPEQYELIKAWCEANKDCKSPTHAGLALMYLDILSAVERMKMGPFLSAEGANQLWTFRDNLAQGIMAALERVKNAA